MSSKSPPSDAPGGPHEARASEVHGLPTTVRAADTTLEGWGSGLPVPDPAEGEPSTWELVETLAPSEADEREVDPGDPCFETVDDPRIPKDRTTFKIGEVARMVGVKPYVLRYWESELAIIQPEKTDTRQRRYRREDVARLLQVRRLRHEEKLSIARIRLLLDRSDGEGPVGLATGASADGPQISIQPSQRAALHRELDEMRRAVRALLEVVED